MGATIHIIDLTYVIDSIMTNNNRYKQDMTNSNDTGNDTYIYKIQVLYQEK